MRRITKSSPAQHNAARDHNGALVMNIYTALPPRARNDPLSSKPAGAAEAARTNYFLVRCVFAPAKRSTKRAHALTADATAIGNGYFSSLCKARFKSVEKHPRPERELGSLLCVREVGEGVDPNGYLDLSALSCSCKRLRPHLYGEVTSF